MDEKELVSILKENAGLKVRIANLKSELKRYRKAINELRYIQIGIPTGLGALKFRFENGSLSEHDYKIAVKHLMDKNSEINRILEIVK